jgi:hypothetical protein
MSDSLVGLALLVAVFGGFSLICSYLNSILICWWELRRRFPDLSRSMPSAHAMTSLRVGPGLIRGVTLALIGVDTAGLHVRGLLLTRLWYRPLLFPWETVDARGTANMWWLGTWETFGVGYYTVFAVPANSKAAALVRSQIQSAREVPHY